MLLLPDSNLPMEEGGSVYAYIKIHYLAPAHKQPLAPDSREIMESRNIATSVIQPFQSLSVSSTTIDFGPDFASNKTPQEIIASVNQHLQLHSGNTIARFRFFFCPLDKFLPDVENFILFAVARGVEELELDFSMDDADVEKKFKVPTCLFECKTLTHLRLSQCEFSPPRGFTGFDQLQHLSLTNVSVTDGELQHLISNSPRLDSMRFVLLTSLESLIVSSQSLRKLTMVNPSWEPYEIEISAPKLESFVYFGVHIFGESTGLCSEPTDSFHDISSLSDAFISAIESSEPDHDFIKLIYDFRHVKVLTLCSYALTWVKIYEDEKLPIVLQNLKELQLLPEIMSTFLLDCIYNFFRLCPSPLLESLFIRLSQYPEGYGAPSYAKEEFAEEPVEVIFCHLKVIKMSNFKGCKSEMRLVKFLLEKAVVLESLILVAPPKSEKENMNMDEVDKKELLDLRAQLLLFSKASPGANIVVCEFLEDDMSVTPTHTEYFDEY